ncbi:replication factor A protein 3 [Desarmillaria tabescens]|uniref:Replication factor A protein 3 n=1 Tax=Armillaria tabescens TaxID=1929756 RepID=A0AA39JXF9_ARMTA|nr:replication factor A protein 3 [Desarmillaria tabescens]KAK0448393.1 replication factor A protein 3 [Desarmillaria tabescens]
MSTNTDISPRVNSAHMQRFIGKTVRLPCKIKTYSSDGGSATVTTSDDGEVVVQLIRDTKFTSTYAEFIGTVVDAGTLKMMAVVGMGEDLDLSLVNKVVEVIHDKRFFERIFS